MDSRFLHTSAALCLLALGAACSPVQSHSGFRPDFNNVALADPEVGVDTQETVRSRFGTPSSSAVFDQTTWYYLSSVQERFAFYTPRTTERRVIVVRFDENQVVSAVERFGMERGRIVAYNGETTPTRGRELGVLEQIFGNIGATPPIRSEEEQQGGRRR